MRILSAMVDVSCERGLQSTSVALIVSRAGISRRTFYDLFEDRGDCFLAAFEEVVAWAETRVVTAYGAEQRWVDRVRAGLLALLVFFDEEPKLAWLCVVEALAAGRPTLTRRADLMQRLTAAVDEGRGIRRGGPPPLTAEGLVGGIFAVIHARLLQGDPGRLSALLNPLMGVIVQPYLGGPQARRELTRPAPRPRAAGHAAKARSPLESVEMRLTYRTLRALAAIAEDPGLSNRQVAKTAGISDQSQISRMLARLATLGLVENTGEGQPKGECNAWRLTSKGQELVQAVPIELGHAGHS